MENVNIIDERRSNCDKWQSKILFLAIFDPRSSIVMSVFDCRISSGISYYVDDHHPRKTEKEDKRAQRTLKSLT